MQWRQIARRHRTVSSTIACPLGLHQRSPLGSSRIEGWFLVRPMWKRRATSCLLRWLSILHGSCLARQMHRGWKERMVNSWRMYSRQSRRSNVGPKRLPKVGDRRVRTPPTQRENWFRRNRRQRSPPVADGHLVGAIPVLRLVQRTGFHSTPRLDWVFRNLRMEEWCGDEAP